LARLGSLPFIVNDYCAINIPHRGIDCAFSFFPTFSGYYKVNEGILRISYMLFFVRKHGKKTCKYIYMEYWPAEISY